MNKKIRLYLLSCSPIQCASKIQILFHTTEFQINYLFEIIYSIEVDANIGNHNYEFKLSLD